MEVSLDNTQHKGTFPHKEFTLYLMQVSSD